MQRYLLLFWAFSLYTAKNWMSGFHSSRRYSAWIHPARCVKVAARVALPSTAASSAIARASPYFIAPTLGRQPSPDTLPSMASQPSSAV